MSRMYYCLQWSELRTLFFVLTREMPQWMILDHEAAGFERVWTCFRDWEERVGAAASAEGGVGGGGRRGAVAEVPRRRQSGAKLRVVPQQDTVSAAGHCGPLWATVGCCGPRGSGHRAMGLVGATGPEC